MKWNSSGEITALAAQDSSIEFKGKKYKANKTVGFAVITLGHSDTRNNNGQAITHQTLKNSIPDAAFGMMDVEHWLEENGRPFDRLCGTIVDYELQEAKAAASEKVPLRALVSIGKRTKEGRDILDDLAKDKNSWRASWEVHCPVGDLALSDGKTVTPWDKLTDEQRALVDLNGCVVKDEKYTLLLGGENGFVSMTGGGFVKKPADKNTCVESLAAASLFLPAVHDREEVALAVAGLIDEAYAQAADAWDTEDAPDGAFAYVPEEARGKDGKKSLRKFPLYSVQKKGLDPAILRNALARLPQSSLTPAEKSAAKGRIMAAIKAWNAGNPKQSIHTARAEAQSHAIGNTEPAEGDGHTHEVLRDLTLMDRNGHTHGMASFLYDPETGELHGKTDSHWQHNPATGDSATHMHTFHFRPDGGGCSDKEEDDPQEGGTMKDGKALAKLIRELAKGHAKETEALAVAAEMEKVDTEKEAQAYAADLVSKGEMVPKADHAKAVAEAKEAGKKEVKEEMARAEAAEKAKSEAIAKRLKVLTDAGYNLDFPMRKGVTLRAKVEAMALASDEDFAAQKEEWDETLLKSGLAKAAANTTPVLTGGATKPSDTSAPSAMDKARKVLGR